uniref:Cytochrome c oxidase subunit 3 n=1 Tax=Clambus sp. CLA01 TaxID=1205546 RepID=A0A0S2MN04_9COLE|nr:cytochrome c oxidase subunit 3 [Clambus sp. CLA01]
MLTHKNHPYHMVDYSPWPLTSALSVLILALGLIKWFHMFKINLFLLGILLTLMSMYQWWRDVIRESTFQGLHTSTVMLGLSIGMALFIISEIFFFISFFWSYFHTWLGTPMNFWGNWPPIGITPFNPLHIPLLNTLVLLTSGFTVTWAHHSLLNNNQKETTQGLLLTVILGVYFTILQGLEYFSAPFTISDSIYGSMFFMSTGFHGLHVLIGTLFLFICLIRQMNNHFSSYHHSGFESASWYWHFVDIVWLFLYIFIYCLTV